MILRSKCKRLKGFEVEWVETLPMDGTDANFDKATYGHKDFDTFTEAEQFAKAVIIGKPIECASVKEFEMSPISAKYPDILEREYVAEPIEVSS